MTPILFHDDCPDGFGSAWVAQKFLPEPELIAMSYGDPVPDQVDGNIVYVLDFCFPPDQLRELCARAEHVRILDHHETAVGYLAEVEDLIPVYGDFESMPAVMPQHWAWINQGRSGVGLAGDWFGLRRPWLDCIEDRDLWRFDLPITPAVFAAVTSRPYTIAAWNFIDSMSLAELAVEGQAIQRYRDQMIQGAVESAWRVNIPGIGKVPIAPCPRSVGSDVAGRLAQNSPLGVGAYFIVRQDSVRLGLRSRRGGPNVAQLAHDLFGGGGHPGASGFEVSRDEFNSWV